jgi:hypothetical protein
MTEDELSEAGPVRRRRLGFGTGSAHAGPATGPAAEASAGPGVRASGPLTWGQQYLYALMEEMRPQSDPLNERFSLTLRAGLTEDEVLGALAGLVEAYEALRTRYTTTPEGPAQQVWDGGHLDVEMVDCAATDAAEATARAMDALGRREFDIAAEWPLRLAVVCVDGAPRHIAFVLCHLAADFAGIVSIMYHLRALTARPPAAAHVPPTRYRMLDEAAWECSPAGRRAGARAVAHHERTYAAMPRTMLFRPVADVPRPRYRYLEFDSWALAAALPALAARHRTSPAAVLWAGLAAVTGFVADLPNAFLELTVGNRTKPRLAGAVGMYNQDAPAWVDLTDASIGDVIDRAAPAVFQAGRFGAYPPPELAAARRRVEHRRGVRLDLSCWLNYREAAAPLGPAPVPPTAEELARARSRTRWGWVDGTDNSTSSYFVFADSRPRRLTLSVTLDSALLPPDEAVAWMQAVEHLLCAAVTEEVGVEEIGKRTGLAPDERGGDWCRTESGWAHVPGVADLVRRAAGTPRAAVLAVPSADGTRLVAHLDGGRGGLDPAALHEACVAGLPGLPHVRTVLAPAEYVVHAGAPSDPDDPAAWRALPVLTSGTGRRPEDRPAARGAARP